MEEGEKEINCYEILGVDKKASDTDIKKAFYKLSLKYHPDKNPGNKEALDMFYQIQEAYKILKDPSKRYVYDEFGSKAKKDINIIKRI